MLVVGLWQGYRNGLMRSLVGLFGWLIALIAATYLAKPFASFFASFTDSSVLAIMMAFLAVALAIIVILQLVLWVLSGALKGLKLSIVDQLAGAVFASAKNLLVILMVLSVVAPFIKDRMIWQNSPIAQALLPMAPFALDFSKRLAAEVKNNTHASLNELDKANREVAP